MRLRLLLLAAIVIAPALAAFALLRLGARGDRAPVAPVDRTADGAVHEASGPDRWLGGALDPGPLSAAHADLAGVSHCLDCHGRASEVLDARCVSCHAEIGLRAQGKVGWHGTFTGPCLTCHVEHRGAEASLIALDRKSFQHQLTRFPLRGEHATAACKQCHELLPLESAGEGGERRSFRYQGVPFAGCASCHVDPHAGRAPGQKRMVAIRQVALDAPAPPPAARDPEHAIAGRDCKSCHTEAGFGAARLKRAGFDHGLDTRFPLEGAHPALACESCHTRERRAEERENGLAPGTAAQPVCAGCHEDPHGGAIRRADGCASCHTPRRWHIEDFDHAAHTKFRLDPLHAALDCGNCHENERFRAAGARCADCHVDAAGLLAGRFDAVTAAADPHAVLKCAECHGDTAAANRRGALAQKCVGCHTPEYGALLATWTARLDALAGASGLDPAEAERLRRSGVHNFALAHERLRASLAPPVRVPAPLAPPPR